MLLRLLFVLCLLSQVLARQSGSKLRSSLTFQVNPGKEECYWESIDVNRPMRMEFEVVRGGMLDIRLKIFDPFENKVVERMAFFNQPNAADNDAAGRVEYVARVTGVHKICFDNSMSKWTPKVVSFAMVENQSSEPDVAKLEHLGPMVDNVIKIGDMLENMEDKQHHLRVRLQYHTDLAESNASRIQWLAIIELTCVIVVTAFQIKQVRSWFTQTFIRSSARV